MSEEEMFARMRERARATNLARADQIEPALADGANPEEVQAGRAAAHSVAGAAGTFGYAEASRLARQIELTLDDVIADGSAVPVSLRDDLVALRAGLQPETS
ncbi:Hpt domain-containing protein [Pedococcus sp. KACC 23699]|uniref:Hpt domain-containing protein n=1 Tax=Pedococcus sp. KACC 23699 TaxID=3149228 RepID=A0AAU7JX94_9MICO